MELSLDQDTRQDAHHVRLVADIADAVRAVPGVGAVAAGDLLGLRVRSDRDPIEFEGCTATGGPGGTVALRAGPGYFATIGLPVRRGRAFTEQDVAGSPAVGLLSETQARRCWPGQDPIGKRFRPARGASTPWVTVVGVAGDTMVSRALDGPQPVYLAVAQGGDVPGTLLVRTAGDPLALVGPVRAAVRRIDPTQPLDRVERLDAGLRRQLGETSLLTGLVGGFGLFALFLGALGVFSVVSHMVADRTREFGIRIALGATAGNVLRLVFGRAALIVGIGAGASIAGTLALARVAFREMAALAATDVVLWASVCGLLAVTALGASLVPARRATRVEPVRALRAE